MDCYQWLGLAVIVVKVLQLSLPLLSKGTNLILLPPAKYHLSIVGQSWCHILPRYKIKTCGIGIILPRVPLMPHIFWDYGSADLPFPKSRTIFCFSDLQFWSTVFFRTDHKFPRGSFSPLAVWKVASGRLSLWSFWSCHIISRLSCQA
jgi:hypothetical protein